MKVRVIIQENEDGQKNITFLTDATIEVKDCLVINDAWANSKVTVSSAIIVASEQVQQALNNEEFRSVKNGSTGLIELTDDEVTVLRARLFSS